MTFLGKVVLITGASSGIGSTTAIEFAKNSANVILVGRDAEKLKKVAKVCEQHNNAKVLTIKADVSIDEDVSRIVETTVNHYRGIDILINSAGFAKSGGIYDGIKIYDQIMATNLRGLYLLTSKCVPHIVKRKGNIVNVSSVAAQKCLKQPHFLAYSMGKAALDQFTKNLALELSGDGVRVNAISPGATKTPFFEAMGVKKSDVDSFLNKIPTALGKIVESEEIADIILFVASDKARSITGCIYAVDNGELLI